ncbi:MAG TPA: hypothetical protein VFS21_25620 [Roseiflexaceae bacterium]|nr:hypothetical protein [Roseiflexaceae bacterium]
MSAEERPAVWWRRIGEDWLSVIVGSALIVLVLLGVISGVPW